jgi:hypothetical protein
MLKIVFIIITTLHGLVHLMGFMKAFNLAKIPQLTANINKSVGLAWLATFALFLFSSGGGHIKTRKYKRLNFKIC